MNTRDHRLPVRIHVSEFDSIPQVNRQLPTPRRSLQTSCKQLLHLLEVNTHVRTLQSLTPSIQNTNITMHDQHSVVWDLTEHGQIQYSISGGGCWGCFLLDLEAPGSCNSTKHQWGSDPVHSCKVANTHSAHAGLPQLCRSTNALMFVFNLQE